MKASLLLLLVVVAAAARASEPRPEPARTETQGSAAVGAGAAAAPVKAADAVQRPATPAKAVPPPAKRPDFSLIFCADSMSNGSSTELDRMLRRCPW